MAENEKTFGIKGEIIGVDEAIEESAKLLRDETKKLKEQLEELPEKFQSQETFTCPKCKETHTSNEWVNNEYVCPANDCTFEAEIPKSTVLRARDSKPKEETKELREDLDKLPEKFQEIDRLQCPKCGNDYSYYDWQSHNWECPNDQCDQEVEVPTPILLQARGTKSHKELMLEMAMTKLGITNETFPKLMELRTKKEIMPIVDETSRIVNERSEQMKEYIDAQKEDVWNREYINELPDNAFAFIEKDGKKDESGLTIPRDMRHLHFKDKAGEVDHDHLVNSIACLPQAHLGSAAKETARKKLCANVRAFNKTHQETTIRTDLCGVTGTSELVRLSNTTHPISLPASIERSQWRIERLTRESQEAKKAAEAAIKSLEEKTKEIPEEEAVKEIEEGILKIATQHETDEDKKHAKEYWDGEKWVPIPTDLPALEQALLKTRTVKQLFTELKAPREIIVKAGEDGSVTAVSKETLRAAGKQEGIVLVPAKEEKNRTSVIDVKNMHIQDFIRKKRK